MGPSGCMVLGRHCLQNALRKVLPEVQNTLDEDANSAVQTRIYDSLIGELHGDLKDGRVLQET